MNKSPILDRCILCPLGCTRPPPPQTCCRLRNKRDEEDSDGDDEELPPSAEEAAKRAKAKEEYKDQCRKVGCTSSAGRGVRYCSQPVRRPHACIFRGGISMALRGHVLLTRLLSLKTLSRGVTPFLDLPDPGRTALHVHQVHEKHRVALEERAATVLHRAALAEWKRLSAFAQ